MLLKSPENCNWFLVRVIFMKNKCYHPDDSVIIQPQGMLLRSQIRTSSVRKNVIIQPDYDINLKNIDVIVWLGNIKIQIWQEKFREPAKHPRSDRMRIRPDADPQSWSGKA
jgi:hypothetical protein